MNIEWSTIPESIINLKEPWKIIECFDVFRYLSPSPSSLAWSSTVLETKAARFNRKSLNPLYDHLIFKIWFGTTDYEMSYKATRSEVDAEVTNISIIALGHHDLYAIPYI